MGGGARGIERGRPPGRLEGKGRLGQRGSHIGGRRHGSSALHARRQYRRRSAATPVPAAANSNERLACRNRDDGAQPWPPHRGPVRRRRPFQASAAAATAAVVVSGLLRLREPVGGGTTIRRGLFATLTCGGCEAPARPARPAASPERYVRRGGLGGSESSTKRAWGAAQVCLPNATALCVRQLWTAAAGVGGMCAAWAMWKGGC